MKQKNQIRSLEVLINDFVIRLVLKVVNTKKKNWTFSEKWPQRKKINS
jgi:hypothetical protein